MKIRFMQIRRVLLILIGIGLAMGCSFTQRSSEIELEITASAAALTYIAEAPRHTQTAAVVAVTYARYYQESTRLAVEVPLTQTALVPFRTAVALTRQPELAEFSTLHPVEITATAVPNMTLEASSNDTWASSDDTWALTATQIVAEITQTAVAGSPALAMTGIAAATSPRCESYIPEQSAAEIETSLYRALVEKRIAAFITVEPLEFNLTLNPYCEGSETLSMGFMIQLQNDRIEPEEKDRVLEQILALLSERFPPVPDYGLHPRLSISHTLYEWVHSGNPRPVGNEISFLIDTDYQNALDAYAEGLRGVDLINALGGWIPDWFHW